MKRVYLHDTLDILQIGSGRNLFLDQIVSGKSNPNSCVWSEKPAPSSTKKKYFDYIAKFLSLAYNNVHSCNIKLQEKRKQQKDRKFVSEKEKAAQEPKIKRLIEINDFQFTTETICTDNMLLNLNFHTVSDFVFDPYITDYITANISLTILTFNYNDEVIFHLTKTQNNLQIEFTRALQLFNMQHKNTQPSDIKFESQKQILESIFLQNK